MTVRAIYTNGVFRPTEPITLPDQTEVQILLPPTTEEEKSLDAIYGVLNQRFSSGHTDTSARHDEHQP